MGLRVTMLGCGTSTGVPVIGCRCAVCTSSDPRNRRLRTSLRLELPAGVAVVDTSPDFRQQALTFGLDRVDAILFTHSHVDHLFGLDDVRVFNFRQGGAIPCYGSAETLAAVRRTFAYAFEPEGEGGGKPRLELIEVRRPFALLGSEVVPVPLLHGSMEVFGYRLAGFAYLTDCSRVPEASRALLGGLEVLILDALRYRPHGTHLSVEEAIALAAEIGARRTIFTHLAHDVDYAAPEVALPAGVEFGYDGLAFDVD
jgi:phosphoribosyl 1,2-cyclic phosphate phosphodiesterase